eukprot:g5560.t1
MPTPIRRAATGRVLLDRLAHRGPDGRGSAQVPGAWLGHRRLAIVDPAGGAQPFRDRGLAWVANGEIYNHADLRPGFGAAPSDSDCAVIGPVWKRLGERTPGALDGPFAFVCVCEKTGRWIAARDEIGINPLYLGRHADGTLWFASEMKALIDDCDSVELVGPGTMWTGGPGQPTRLTRWHAPAWASSVPDAPADYAALRHALIESVRKRTMADVPWGVLISGGVDSSLIASIATRLAREHGAPPPHSFSIGLAGGPDLAPARRVAEFLGTRHHEFTFTIDEALDAIPTTLEHLESDQQVRTGVPTMLLARRVRELGFKMVMSGEGADEIFGGYLYFHRAPSPEAFHEETVRKTLRLHQYDVMRANKAPMACGLEVRVPFLDRAFVDLAMGTDPRDRAPRAGGGGHAIEKALLREAFDDARDPWLPRDVLWRQKEQFSDGVGYGWVDAVRDRADALYPPELLATAPQRFPEDTPCNAEMMWMRELFEDRFVRGRASGRSALRTVGAGRSIACSTPEAVSWDPSWARLAGDISGRAIAGVHASGQALRDASPPPAASA